VDPFTILALAKGAVAAIKQGCELYNEFKGTLVEARDAIDEVRGNVAEVAGFWGAFKKWIAGSPASPSGPEPTGSAGAVAKPTIKKGKKQFQEFDEVQVRKNIADELVKFFKAYEQLKDHIAEEESKSKNIYDPDKNMMEAALYRVLAMDEMERLQIEIRETMIYQTPGMGDLYTRVIKMVGVIGEEQEFARAQKAKMERDARWRRRRARDKLVDVTLGAVGIFLIAAYLGGMWWVLIQDRIVRWGF
jgi:hypothetical protein